MTRGLRPKTSQLLGELTAAGTKQAGQSILEQLLQLMKDRAYWHDFEVLLTSPEYDDPRYWRRLDWRLKVHLVEALTASAAPGLRVRLYEALRGCAKSGGPSTKCRETLEHLVSRSCRTGSDAVLDFAHRVLASEDRALRREVLEGLVMAQFGPFEPRFAREAASILEAELPDGSDEDRESWLKAIHVFAPERWRELISVQPPPPPPVWDAEWYRLSGASGQWGDYGYVLFHGLASIQREGDHLIVLERTGPLVPPVTVPSDVGIVVTNAMRGELEADGFARVAFRPVVIQKLTAVAWHEWDRSYPQPAQYPAQSEPENYVMGRKDRPALHEQVGPLWQLLQEPPETVRTRRDASTIVSVSLAKFLYERAGEWLLFTPEGAR
jgi:hypothetical protein